MPLAFAASVGPRPPGGNFHQLGGQRQKRVDLVVRIAIFHTDRLADLVSPLLQRERAASIRTPSRPEFVCSRRNLWLMAQTHPRCD
jgi:hypothetical protein